MNTINNPLIVTWEFEEPGFNRYDEGHWEYKLKGVDPRFESGSYIDSKLAEEMLEALEDYRDFLITGVSGVSAEEICELILKAKG